MKTDSRIVLRRVLPMFLMFALGIAGSSCTSEKTGSADAKVQEAPEKATNSDKSPGGELPVAKAETLYYSGTTQVSSPDGSIPYGAAKAALVARTVDESAGTIVEVVLDEGNLRTTTLSRVGETNVFEASDAENSFSGELTFVGEPWQWTGWTYEITMTDGSGTIKGVASIDETSMHTEKYFVDPNGDKQVRIVEELKVIPKAKYDELLDAK